MNFLYFLKNYFIHIFHKIDQTLIVLSIEKDTILSLFNSANPSI